MGDRDGCRGEVKIGDRCRGEREERRREERSVGRKSKIPWSVTDELLHSSQFSLGELAIKNAMEHFSARATLNILYINIGISFFL